MKFLRWSRRTKKVAEAKKINTINEARKTTSSGLVNAPATLNSAWKPKAGVTIWTGKSNNPSHNPNVCGLSRKYPPIIETIPIVNRWTCVKSCVMMGNAR